MTHHALLGFRQLLHNPESYQDLSKIIIESQKLFSHDPGLIFAVAVCGDNPFPFLQSEKLLDKVSYLDVSSHSSSPANCAQMSKDLFKPGSKNIVILYYDSKKRGLTFPFAFLTEFSILLNVDLVGLSDSDFQIPYSAIKRSYLDAKEKISELNTPVLYLPRRSHRSLELEGYPINRFAMEDIENAYYWVVTKRVDRFKNLDLQSGLCFLNRAACLILDFSKTGVWTGAIDTPIQIKQHKGDVVEGIIIDTNPQNISTISPDIQFKKIKELEDLYGCPLGQLIDFALHHPECLMDDWAKYLRQEERKMILDKILYEYGNYQSKA